MKKFLSLVLALIMTMSLVTVSAGAKDFTDDESLTYDEAVAVMSEIGVIDGYPDGTFKPQNGLTRGAAAKIICNMILGPTTAAALRADTAPFKDVAVDNQYAGYIAYCVQQGITSGYTDGTYRPAAPLTSFAFMKMLLGALGYDAEIEGYVGANCFINVAKQAIGIGLDAGLTEDFDGGKQITREEAALFAFNTLKADLVEYETKITSTINGQTVTIGNSAAKAMTWKNSATRKNNIKADNYVQFAEQYFTKLVKEDVIDVFGRPARTWTFKGEEIGTYVNADLLVESYTKKVTGKALYDLLGKAIINDKEYDFFVYVDGESKKATLDAAEAYFDVTYMDKNYDKGVGATGNGVLTEVYVDTDAKEVTVAVINTYLARASADYSSKKDEVSLDVYGIGKVTGDAYMKTLTNGEDKLGMDVSGEDFDIEDVKEKDAFLVTVADKAVQTMEPAEILADSTITAFKKESNVTVDGEKYSYASSAEYDFEVLDNYTGNGVQNLKEKTYNVYLDQYGYAIGVDLVSGTDNYLFLTGLDTNTSNLSNKTADGFAIFLDGTTENIKVNMDAKKTVLTAAIAAATPATDGAVPNYAILNTWCTYTVDKNGVYSLKEVPTEIDYQDGNKTKQHSAAQNHADTQSYEIDKKHVSLPGGAASAGSAYYKVYGNNDSVYLTADLKKITNNDGLKTVIIEGVDNVTTGVKNANITTTTSATILADTAYTPADAASGGVYTLYKKTGYIIGAVVIGEDAAASKNLVYVKDNDVQMESYSTSDDEWTWTLDVIIDGKEAQVQERGSELTNLAGLSKNTWYVLKYDADGFVIDVDTIPTEAMDKKDGNASEYVTDIEKIEASINKYDTVLYEQLLDDMPKVPYLKGSTFFVDTKNAKGFFVAEDVKAVLIQTNGKKTTTTFEEGVENLEDLVANLNNKKGADTYGYTVNAIFEDGAATVVIIEDKYDSTGITPAGVAEETPDTVADVAINTGAAKITVTLSEGVALGDEGLEDDVKNAVGIELEAADFVVTGWGGAMSTSDGKGLTVSAVTDGLSGNVTRTFNVVVEAAPVEG